MSHPSNGGLDLGLTVWRRYDVGIVVSVATGAAPSESLAPLATRFLDRAACESLDEITTHYERYLAAMRLAFQPGTRAAEQFALAGRILRDDILPRAVELRDFNAAQIEASQERHLGKLERMIGGLAAVGGIGSIAGLGLGYGLVGPPAAAALPPLCPQRATREQGVATISRRAAPGTWAPRTAPSPH